MSNSIDKYADIIDSRDVIARIEELEELQADTVCPNCDGDENYGSLPGDVCDTCNGSGKGVNISEDELTELAILKALAEEASGYADWKYGETLIRDSYFKEYAMELADDIGATNSEAAHNWPLTCIDWDQAARELQMDYTSVEFDGVTYWIRCS